MYHSVSYCVMLYCILSYYIILYHIISYYIIFCRIPEDLPEGTTTGWSMAEVWQKCIQSNPRRCRTSNPLITFTSRRAEEFHKLLQFNFHCQCCWFWRCFSDLWPNLLIRMIYDTPSFVLDEELISTTSEWQRGCVQLVATSHLPSHLLSPCPSVQERAWMPTAFAEALLHTAILIFRGQARFESAHTEKSERLWAIWRLSRDKERQK